MNTRDIILKKEQVDKFEFTEDINKDKDFFVFSSNMFIKSTMQNYLSILYSEENNQEQKITDTTIESLMIDGINSKLKQEYGDNIEFNKKFQHKHNEEWILESTIETLVYNGVYVGQEINKLSYQYTVDKFNENKYEHSYTKIIDFNYYLLSKNFNEVDILPSNINFFIKDSKNKNTEESFFSDTVSNATTGYILSKINTKITDLDKYLKSGEIPSICDELLIKKDKDTGKFIPIRCITYCEHGKTGRCPYYNNITNEIITTNLGQK